MGHAARPFTSMPSLRTCLVLLSIWIPWLQSSAAFVCPIQNEGFDALARYSLSYRSARAPVPLVCKVRTFGDGRFCLPNDYGHGNQVHDRLCFLVLRPLFLRRLHLRVTKMRRGSRARRQIHREGRPSASLARRAVAMRAASGIMAVVAMERSPVAIRVGVLRMRRSC